MKVSGETRTMAYKDLMMQLSSYPTVTAEAAIVQGVAVAGLLGARLSALTFEIDIPIPGHPLALALLDIPGMVAAEREKSVKGAREALRVFDSAARERGISARRILERSLAGNIPEIITEHARLRDLTIIPVGDRENQLDVAEHVIFGSGRPVLVVPEKPRIAGSQAFDKVGIAWDFSRPAARALADALPLLQHAKRIRVVTVTHEKRIDNRRSMADLENHLAIHGIDAVLEEEDAHGRTIGQTLEEYARDRDLDLLVMGAYGHSRLRDFILGGATRAMRESG